MCLKKIGSLEYYIKCINDNICYFCDEAECVLCDSSYHSVNNIDLCKQLETNNNTINYHMGTVKNITNDITFNYTYILEKGISNVKGGFKVLADMDYPSEILNICSKQI